MKTLLSLVLVLSSFAIQAQNATLIAVINTSNTCTVTSANLNRIETELKSQYNAQQVQWVVNDLSTEATRAASKQVLTETRLFSALKNDTETGIISIFHGNSKRPLTRVSMSKTTAELQADFQKAFSLVQP